MRGRGPVRPGLLAERERLQVVAVLLDDGGRTDLDRWIAREHRRASVDDVAEEYDPAEAERGGARHDARLGRWVTRIRTRLVRRDSPLREARSGPGPRVAGIRGLPPAARPCPDAGGQRRAARRPARLGPWPAGREPTRPDRAGPP